MEESSPRLKNKTIYDAGNAEIFWKNFLAGLGRGLGGAFIYLIFSLLTAFLILRFVVPKIAPVFNTFSNLYKTPNSGSNSKTAPSNTFLENMDIEKLFSQ